MSRISRIELSCDVIGQVAHTALQQAIRDLYPQGFEFFYPEPPELEQIIADAFRYRYIRDRGGRLVEDYFGAYLDEAVDRYIDRYVNKEQDS